jgi:hypothetical protein
MEEAELMAIFAASRARNMKDAITGMLLYKDGGFMQVLEGAGDAIDRAYARIRRDPRHKDRAILRGGEIDARGFPGWSMGFRSVNAAGLEAVSVFARFGAATVTAPENAAKPHIALRLLKIFHQTMR